MACYRFISFGKMWGGRLGVQNSCSRFRQPRRYCWEAHLQLCDLRGSCGTFPWRPGYGISFFQVSWLGHHDIGTQFLVQGAQLPNFVRSSPILLEWWLFYVHTMVTKLVSTCEWQIWRNIDDNELKCLWHQGWYENHKFIEMHSRAIMG